MRNFLVLTLASLMIAASAVGVRADNQTAADNIATGLSEQFPNEDITIQFQDGKVWLRGQVASQTEMLKMIQFVNNLEGVTLVENEMTLARAVVAPATGNLPRIEKTEIVQIAVNTPVQTMPAAPVRQASRVPARKAPMPVVITTADAFDEEEIIVQTGNRKLRAVPAQEIIVNEHQGGMVASNHVGVQAPLAIGAQPAYVTRGPQEYMAQGGEQMGGASQYAGGCQPNVPNYAWPSYAAHPNYAQVTYPKYYKANCWPNMGPFYPYPKPPLGWRKVTMEWHDGKWWLDFDDGSAKGPFSPLFRDQPTYR